MERALTLTATGTLTIAAAIREARATKKAIKMPPVINPETGRISTRHTAFSEVSWGKPTRQYLASINKNVDDAAMKKIIDEAIEYSKASADGAELESGSDNDRAQLPNNGSDSEDEFDDDAQFNEFNGKALSRSEDNARLDDGAEYNYY
jgi:hypothetical protein